MSNSLQDLQLANAAAGFTVGFRIFTVWKAVKQTSQLKNPWKSCYIRIVWGEIIANMVIVILAWLFLNNLISPSITTYSSYLIISLIFLHYQLVLMQFHPVAHMVKLNIEMTMARLIKKIVTSSMNDFKYSIAGIPTFTQYWPTSSNGSNKGNMKNKDEDERRIVVVEDVEIDDVMIMLRQMLKMKKYND